MNEQKPENVNEDASAQSVLNAVLYIVKLEDGVWLAPWDGDPGRTLNEKSAKKFTTQAAAHKAIAKALRFREFKSPTVQMYNDGIKRAALATPLE